MSILLSLFTTETTSLNTLPAHISPTHSSTANMKKNDVIAIIIIILFIILAGVSFGIWKLVSMAKNHMSATGSSRSSTDIAD
ncbi:hypothetical protein FG05_13301 [Fusarium graminearum]|nr:hypothetical protein FG05_13301 [Fusarium graminearum]